MKCPNCKDVTLLISERNNVEIDYCPECRGVWLDRGELDKILDRVNSSSAEKYEDKYERFNDEHKSINYKEKDYKKNQSKPKKRESIFGEIFDIFGD